MPRKRAVSTSSDEAEPPNVPNTNDVDETESDSRPRATTKSASRPKHKRRPSAPFADASNSGNYSVPTKEDESLSNSTRGNPRTASLNTSTNGFTEVDDRAEKRKRRKSTRVSFVAASSDGEDGDAGVGEAQAEDGPSNRDLNRSSGSRPSMRTGRQSLGASLRINAVAPAPPPAISMDVMNSNFEEWMKMATDNKINAANSWNFALIDYFHDMSLLRNTDDNSINFQKASFTLDGCVKIWTSRVDSVGTETGKLLSNLAQEKGGRGEDDDDNDEGGGEDGDGDDEGGGKKKQKVHRTEATLVKSYTQLQVKKLDLDFAVDPLFRKTRAEFDEGGATGLLLNHLGVDSKMRVVFDSGDSKITTEGDEDDEEELNQPIELDHIRANLLPPLETLDERSIAQHLADFRFSSDPSNLDFAFLKGRDGDDPDASIVSHRLFVPNEDGGAGPEGFDFNNDDGAGGGAFDHFGAGGAAAEDFFTGDQAVEDFAGGPAGFQPFGPDDDSIEGVARNRGVVGGMEPFDPRRAPNERDLVMAMTMGGEGDDGEMLDYFDSKVMKNWAGPEHWKLRRAITKKADAADPSAPKVRKEKVAFTIDFLEESEQTAKQMFVPATKATMITLPAKSGAGISKAASKAKKSKVVEKRDDHRLPDDMHFTSQQLLRLFLKPKFTLKMRRYGVASGQLDDNGDGEVDQHFWAEANQMGGDELDQTAGGGPIPFNTQFFHDDFDDGTGGFDDDFEGGGGGADGELPVLPNAVGLDEEGDLIAATQGPLKRVRPEFVNYARKAKRVDVRKLKENIWRGLKIITPKDAHTEAESEEIPEDQLTDPKQASNFNNVISGLRSTYSKDKMDEISTSFCFICLLHLANERGLKIDVSEDRIIPDDDEDEGSEADKLEERKVGDIWSLNVYRDPTASASA